MRSLLFAVALFLLMPPVHAADSARARLDAFAKGLQAVSAHFAQTVYDVNGQPADRTEGTLALSAPRQFRWETTTPYKQLIVADGMQVWIYDPELEQVTVRNQGVEESHSPLTVLTDLGQLDREFRTSEQGSHDGCLWLRLKSTAKDPQFEYADLGFGPAGLERMDFKDILGNRTEIRFSAWQRNPKLPAGTFKFTPPKGADVIGDITPEAEVHPLKQ